MAFFQGPNIVTDGLILALDAASARSYPGSGNTWYDLSNNGNNASLVNVVHSDEYNGIMQFEDTADHATLSAGFGTNTTDITWSFWIRITTWGNYHYLVDNSPGADGFAIRTRNDQGNEFESFAYADNGGAIVQTRNDNLSINTWYNYVVQFTSSANAIISYLNGGNKVSTAGSIGNIDASTADTDIGTDYGGGSDLINDMAIIHYYNRVLSADEVAQNYNALKSRFGL
tara:strand:+ start:279 stop:965 length:687 start_codon:yes stop_codon:yes gene_type:complete